MFYHVVMMRLKGDDDAFHARVGEYVRRVRSELSYVRDYRYGRNVAGRAKGYDWVVAATFDTSADHDRYQVSPAHQEMKAYMTPFIDDLVVCDHGDA